MKNLMRCMLLVSALLGCKIANAEPNVDASALEKLRNAWINVRDRYSGFRAVVTDKANVGPDKEMISNYVVKSRGKSHAIIEQQYVKNSFQKSLEGALHVSGQNSHDQFFLVAGSQKGLLRVEKYLLNSDIANEGEYSAVDMADSYVYPLRALSFSVDKLLDSLEIVSLEPKSDSTSANFWVLKLRQQSNAEIPLEGVTVDQLILTLDADNDWSVVEYDIQYVDGGSCRGSKTYRRSDLGTYPGTETSKELSVVRTVTFEDFAFTEVPYDEFELSFYNLSPPSSGSAWRRYLVLAGALILLASGFYFIRRGRMVR